MAATALHGQTFQWPVEYSNPRIIQVYAGRDVESMNAEVYGGGKNFHTGVDIGDDGSGARVKVVAAAAGRVVAIWGLAGAKGAPTEETVPLYELADNEYRPSTEDYRDSTSNHGLGVSIIIANDAVGNFSLYAHLDSIRKDLFVEFRQYATDPTGP